MGKSIGGDDDGSCEGDADASAVFGKSGISGIGGTSGALDFALSAEVDGLFAPVEFAASAGAICSAGAEGAAGVTAGAFVSAGGQDGAVALVSCAKVAPPPAAARGGMP